jgi:hypothetical protein
MDKLVEIYSKAIRLAQGNNQTVGENNDYYITLAQLEQLLGWQSHD